MIKLETERLVIRDHLEEDLAGLNRLKEADFKRHVWHDGEWKDRVEYALLREEWQRMKDPAQQIG